MSTGLRHVGIVVSDLERMTRFFIEDLEFSVLIDQLETGAELSEILNLPEVEVRTVKLKNENGSAIELLRFSSHPPKSPTWSGSLTTVGLTHIALQSKNVDRESKQLEDKGYDLLSEPIFSSNGKAKLCFIQGPENLLIELVQTDFSQEN